MKLTFLTMDTVLLRCLSTSLKRLPLVGIISPFIEKDHILDTNASQSKVSCSFKISLLPPFEILG